MTFFFFLKKAEHWGCIRIMGQLMRNFALGANKDTISRQIEPIIPNIAVSGLTISHYRLCRCGVNILFYRVGPQYI